MGRSPKEHYYVNISGFIFRKLYFYTGLNRQDTAVETFTYDSLNRLTGIYEEHFYDKTYYKKSQFFYINDNKRKEMVWYSSNDSFAGTRYRKLKESGNKKITKYYYNRQLVHKEAEKKHGDGRTIKTVYKKNFFSRTKNMFYLDSSGNLVSNTIWFTDYRKHKRYKGIRILTYNSQNLCIKNCSFITKKPTANTCEYYEFVRGDH